MSEPLTYSVEGMPSHYRPCGGCSNTGTWSILRPETGRTAYFCASCYEREQKRQAEFDKRGWLG